jgi:hypothetical protein
MARDARLWAFRSRLKAKRQAVALPRLHLRWLGLDVEALDSSLRGRSIFSCQYDEDAFLRASLGEDIWSRSLGDALHYAVAIEMEECRPRLDDGHKLESATRWRGRLGQLHAGCLKLFTRTSPSAVVVVQGYEVVNAVARSAAIRLGIPVLAVENTGLVDRMLWDNLAGITTNRNLAKSYFWKFKGIFDPDLVDSYHESLIDSLQKRKSAEHRSSFGRLSHNDGRPTVVFIGQVFTDSSIIFGLREWESPLEILSTVARWCEAHNYRLVVKLHPKEVCGRSPITDKPYDKLTFRKINDDRALFDLLGRIDAVVDSDNELDTYALLESAAVAITVNSQAGLEALLLGTPVVVCGDAFYAGLGFTFDALSPGELDARIEQALAATTTQGAAEFAYIFYEHYCCEKSVRALSVLIEREVARQYPNV